MKPVIVLVGRPNVGKSTLFNRLVGSPEALVSEEPGATRDRLYGVATLGDRSYFVVDTGGLSAWFGEKRAGVLEREVSRQVWSAVAEADAVILLTDAREGLRPDDQAIAEHLRREGVRVWLAANKAEGIDPDLAVAEFHALGLGTPCAISAAHGDGVMAFMRQVLAALPNGQEQEPISEREPVIAIVGRPNVGKSTLANALLGEERVLVSTQPGTTRDNVRIPLRRGGRQYVLIDTAGVRRRARIRDRLEQFSVMRTLQAVEAANVVILVLDARARVSDQDAALAGTIVARGRGIVVAVNKSDALEPARRRELRGELERRLGFLRFARSHFISARERTGLGALLGSVDRAFASGGKTLRTPTLNRVLRQAVQLTPPPRAPGGPVRLKFAHQGGRNPPRIVIHGNRVKTLPASYRRYLANSLCSAFGLEGTPVQIELREGENPYEEKGKSAARARKKGRRVGRAAARPTSG